jgi:hypothetical protein
MITSSARTPVVLAAALAGAALALSLTGCGGSAAAAESRACGLARAAQRGTSAATMNGRAMATYATALTDTRATGALALPVGQAVTDARDAEADARQHDRAQYGADAELFISDLVAIESECQSARVSVSRSA